MADKQAQNETMANDASVDTSVRNVPCPVSAVPSRSYRMCP